MDVEAVAPARRASRAAYARAWLAALCWLLPASAAAQTVPTTFGTLIGNSLLCRDDIDNTYYYRYLAAAFGAPYKHDGGAYWFKTDSANLWGVPVSEVMVSDDSSALVFIGAVADVTAEELDKAIVTQVGVHYAKIDSSAYPVREASPGSRIVYFDLKSKIYCAKFKPLPPGLR